MKALLLGGNGQTASYLAELLLEKNYEVIFVCRRVSVDSTERIRKSLKSAHTKLIQADITDFSSLLNCLSQERPEQIYNFAAQSQVGTSFKCPIATTQSVQLGHLNLLEVVKFLKDLDGYNPKVYYACSSEQFGQAYSIDEDGLKYQNEDTKFVPQSPYAIAKTAAYHYNRLYRQSYNMNCRSGILNNHESPRRGADFVTRKITLWLGRFHKWLKDNGHYGIYDNMSFTDDNIRSNITGKNFPKLRLGNISTSRAFGHARDYCRAILSIMESDENDDYVVSNNDSHTVEDFLVLAFEFAGFCQTCIKDLVITDESLYRPSEVEYLKGDYSKIKNKLGWEPETSFAKLVAEMVQSDIRLAAHENME